jgi:replication-associated recombination protein RarA
MPARRKRAGRSMRASSAARKLISLSIAMEVPLNEATDAVHALRLIGYGLEGQGKQEVGRAVAQIAWDACQRLDALRETWHSLREIAAKSRAP